MTTPTPDKLRKIVDDILDGSKPSLGDRTGRVMIVARALKQFLDLGDDPEVREIAERHFERRAHIDWLHRAEHCAQANQDLATLLKKMGVEI